MAVTWHSTIPIELIGITRTNGVVGTIYCAVISSATTNIIPLKDIGRNVTVECVAFIRQVI